MDENRALVSRLATMVMPAADRLVESDDPWEPHALIDPAGVSVEGVGEFLRELRAAGRASATARSYGMDLLR